jgi:hypothetical protein
VVRRIEVEVFPVERDRWIAVIEDPPGAFSTEALTPDDVERVARKAIAEVLGWIEGEIVHVDDLGSAWSPSRAAEQAARLLR